MASELFTATPPTEPGWYWFQLGDQYKTRVVEVDYCRDVLSAMHCLTDVRKCSGKWGPRVPMPAEFAAPESRAAEALETLETLRLIESIRSAGHSLVIWPRDGEKSVTTHSGEMNELAVSFGGDTLLAALRAAAGEKKP